MPAFVFLHAADLHLDSPLLGLRRRVGEGAAPFVDATRKAFENLVSVAIERRVAFVILSGDLFDGDWKDFASGQFVVRQFSRLDREGIPVFLIRGNHDAENVVTKSLPVPGNVTSLSVRGPQTIKLGHVGVAIHGRGFATRHVEDNVVLSYPQAEPGLFNLGMLHTSLTGRDGHGVYAPCSLDDLKSRGYQYWALGHIHEREIVHEDPHVVFPGNVQARHSKEQGPKGCMIVTVENGRVAHLEFYPCDVARFVTVETILTGIDTLEDAYQLFRKRLHDALPQAEGRPLAVRVLLTGATPLHRRLSAERRALEEGLQAVAAAASEDWLIEKVVDATCDVGAEGGSSVVPYFDEALEQAAADEHFQAGLAQTWSDLKASLPKDVLDRLSRADADPQEYMQLILADTLATLVSSSIKGDSS